MVRLLLIKLIPLLLPIEKNKIVYEHIILKVFFLYIYIRKEECGNGRREFLVNSAFPIKSVLTIAYKYCDKMKF